MNARTPLHALWRQEDGRSRPLVKAYEDALPHPHVRASQTIFRITLHWLEEGRLAELHSKSLPTLANSTLLRRTAIFVNPVTVDAVRTVPCKPTKQWFGRGKRCKYNGEGIKRYKYGGGVC